MMSPSAVSPFSLVLFGASGSLARLKIYPALYELAQKRRLPSAYHIIGYGRSQMDEGSFRKLAAESIRANQPQADEEFLAGFLLHMRYCTGDYGLDKDYLRLVDLMQDLEKGLPHTRLFYFAVPPEVFEPSFQCLGKLKLHSKSFPQRLVIEKPFGHDRASAENLKKKLHALFRQNQIFLLDHYLGKEAVANLLSLRYANTVISAIMQRRYIRNIQINAWEARGIEGRGNYFDHTGILRDMVQSHLLQILSVLTMDLPAQQTPQAVHRKKVSLLRSIRLQDIPSSVVRGQYEGYLDETGVRPDSQTETYIALKLFVNHPFWKGVPFYLRTGKGLARQWTSVVVEFHPHCSLCARQHLPPNRLIFQIQPDQEIQFHLLTKVGGKTFDFHHLKTGQSIYCTGECLSEYARLILDALAGKRELFLNFEEVLSAWKAVDPIQRICSRMREERCRLQIYPRASFGPPGAEAMMRGDRLEWYHPP